MLRKPYRKVRTSGSTHPSFAKARTESKALMPMTAISRSSHSHSFALAVRLSG